MANSADPDQLAWIYTVCKCRVYPGSAGQGLTPLTDLNFTTLLANSADDKLIMFSLFSPENKIWHFMIIVSIWVNLYTYEISPEDHPRLTELNFATLLAKSADDKLIILCLIFQENKIWHFM